MDAEIIALPCAASLPVVQHPRRGRFPRGVVSIKRKRPPNYSDQDKALLLAIDRLRERIRRYEAAGLSSPERNKYIEITIWYIRLFIGVADLPEELMEFSVLGNKYAESELCAAANWHHLRVMTAHKE